MWSSPLFWIALAVALFWALGAYNRLMRLRSAVVQAFGSFDAHMVRGVALLGEFTVAADSASRVDLRGSESQDIAALHGATTQLSASLAVARARPLDADAIAALVAARNVLVVCWQAAVVRAQAETLDTALEATDAPEARLMSGAKAPVAAMGMAPLWQTRWGELAAQAEQAAHVYDDAVAQYNAAISQFPASVLAWVFGFKDALGLRAAT